MKQIWNTHFKYWFEFISKKAKLLLLNRVNNIAADGLVMTIARPSATMIVTDITKNSYEN